MSKRSRSKLPKWILDRGPTASRKLKEQNLELKQLRESAKMRNHDEHLEEQIIIDYEDDESPRNEKEDTRKVLTFTPALIEKLNKIPKIEGQRDLDMGHVWELVEHFHEAPLTFRISLASINETRYLFDGQHTLFIANIWPELVLNRHVSIDTYFCRGTKDAEVLYRQCDCFKRSPTGQMRPAVVRCGFKLSEGLVSPLIGGIEFVLFHTRHALNVAEKCELMEQYSPFLHWVHEHAYNVGSGHGSSMPRGMYYYAFLFLIWNIDPMLAAQFCKEVIEGGGRKGDPIREFVDFQYTHDPIRSNGDPFEHYLNFLITCWNAYKLRRKMRRLYNGTGATRMIDMEGLNTKGMLLFQAEFEARRIDVKELGKKNKDKD